MSLYTLSGRADLPALSIPAGLTIARSSNIEMLAALCDISLEEVQKRIANKHIAFVACIDNQPAAFGWMAEDTARIGELNHEFALPAGNRYLWNFRTLEAFKGRGIYPALLQHIVQSSEEDICRFWIIHAPENGASLRGIRKAGFNYVGKLYVDSGGIAVVEATDAALALRASLGHMNIHVSAATANSCWNCSSPFIRKRSLKCCCLVNNQKCLGRNRIFVAA